MKIEEFKLYKWYHLKDSTVKPETIISFVKKRIDDYGDFEFNESYSKFRRIDNTMPNGINIVMELKDGTRFNISEDDLKPRGVSNRTIRDIN